MQEVTLRLVKESFGETYYDKALDCVKALRSEAVSVSWMYQYCDNGTYSTCTIFFDIVKSSLIPRLLPDF